MRKLYSKKGQKNFVPNKEQINFVLKLDLSDHKRANRCSLLSFPNNRASTMVTLKEIATKIEKRWSNRDQTKQIVEACLAEPADFDEIGSQIEKLADNLEDNDDIEYMELVQHSIDRLHRRSMGLKGCIAAMRYKLDPEDQELFMDVVAMFRKFDKAEFKKLCEKHWTREECSEAADILADFLSNRSPKRSR